MGENDGNENDDNEKNNDESGSETYDEMDNFDSEDKATTRSKPFETKSTNSAIDGPIKTRAIISRDAKNLLPSKGFQEATQNGQLETRAHHEAKTSQNFCDDFLNLLKDFNLTSNQLTNDEKHHSCWKMKMMT
jgi:hypothetical protein